MLKKLFAMLVLVVFLTPTVAAQEINETPDIPDLPNENDTETNELDLPDTSGNETKDELETNDTEEITEDLNEEDIGVTPDNFLWGVDKALDRIGYLLTFGPEARANKGLLIAQERLLEIKAMCEAGKIGPCTKAQEAHTEVLEDIETDIAELNGDEDSLETEIEVEEELERQVTEVNKIKVKIKGELTPEQQEALDNLIASFEGKASEIQIKIKNKQEETKVKIKARTGKSEIEIEEDTEELRSKVKDRVKIRSDGEKLEVKLEGISSETKAKVLKLVDLLKESKTLTKIELKVKNGKFESKVRGDLTEAQLSLLDEITESIQASGKKAKIKIELKLDDEDKIEIESEDDDDEDKIEIESEDDDDEDKIEIESEDDDDEDKIEIESEDDEDKIEIESEDDDEVTGAATSKGKGKSKKD